MLVCWRGLEGGRRWRRGGAGVGLEEGGGEAGGVGGGVERLHFSPDR